MDLILNSFTKSYVVSLATHAIEESAIFPVDRVFVEEHLETIKSLNPLSFLYHNFELVNDLYTNRLLACLPEIWDGITLDDLVTLCENFTNQHSFFTLINFTYKYIEIDIIAIVLSTIEQKRIEYLGDVIQYLQRQWNVMIKSEEDMLDFKDGFIDVDPQKWLDIKRVFLADQRVKPALLTYIEMETYINRIAGKTPTWFKI